MLHSVCEVDHLAPIWRIWPIPICRILFSDKLIVRIWHIGAGVTLYGHMEIILFPKRRDGGHHWRRVMGIDGFLAGPAIDEEDGLRIVQRLVILIAEVSFFGPDGIDGAA